MDKQYIENQYHQAMLDFKCAKNEEEQWDARKAMARLETLAIVMFGTDFQNELRKKEMGTSEEQTGTPNRRADTDLQLSGTVSQDTLDALDQAGYTYQEGTIQPKKVKAGQEAARFVEEYSGKIEQQAEDNKNFLIEDSSIFPFEVREGYHAALRYAYIGKGDRFEDIKTAESEIRMNVTAVIYKDGTLNEYDQGIEEKKFTLKGIESINGFCNKLEQSVKNSIKAHPDIQPVVTVNYSEYGNYNPLVGDHMRLSLDRANSLFELIDIVAGKEAREKGTGTYYKTSADIMYVQHGKTGHFDLGQEFGKSAGSIIKQIEGYIDEQIKYLNRHPELPDGESRLKDWETAKKELIPYFNSHISLSRAERDLEYMGKAASVMQDNIFEMRAFLNTGMIVPVPEAEKNFIELTKDKEQVQETQTQEEKLPNLAPMTEPAFSQQIDDVLSGKANRYNAVKVCATPELLVQAGCSQLPMFITQAHIKDILHPKDSRNPHWHGLTVRQLKRVPELISDPVMILDSANKKDSIIVTLGEADNEKLPLIVSVRPHGKGMYELSEVETNFITSIYGKDGFSKFIEKAIREDRMVYCSKQKSQELFSVLGLQLPQGFNNLDFNKIIHLSRNAVKSDIAVKDAPEAAEDRVYLELPYMSKEKFSIVLQELKQNGAKFDVESKRWYVDKSSADSGRFNAYIRTYLTLPHMGKEEFGQVRQQLKQDGARFDTMQKKWYIDANCDRSKFQAYLTTRPKERPSVLDKLQSARKMPSVQEGPGPVKDAGQHRHENIK